MTHDDVARLPTTVTTGEVAVMEQPDGLLVGGDPESVDAYLKRLRETAGNAAQIAGLDKAGLANAAGLVVGVAALLQQAGKFVHRHPDSVAAVQRGQRIELDNFASARHHQVEGWKDMETPGVREAVDAAVEIAKPVAEKAIAAAGRGLSNLRGFMAQRFNQKETVGNDAPLATPEPEVDR